MITTDLGIFKCTNSVYHIAELTPFYLQSMHLAFIAVAQQKNTVKRAELFWIYTGLNDRGIGRV